MIEITKKAWAVYRSAFKDGEKVVVEDCHGRFYWGKLSTTNEGVTLASPGGKSKMIFWDELEFICHDGFPVNRIMGMTAKEAAKRAARTPLSIIREALEGPLTKVRRFRFVGGGCPWIAECRLVETHNRGNIGPKFYYEDDEEVMVFASPDGAIMHSYDTEHLFLNV